MNSKVFNLIKFLKVDSDDFYHVLKTPYSEMYKTFHIKKRNGKKRLIEAPNDEALIHIQKRIKIWLEEDYGKYISKHAFGYVKNKSILDNAREHFRPHSCSFIIKIDLKDFFNTISYERVYRLFKKGLDKSDEASKAIARIVTKDRHLPQGACTSPVISNMICKKMDRQLAFYTKNNNGIYSRYADDIFFSFNNKEDALKMLNSTELPRVVLSDTVSHIINMNGFIVNEAKTKYLSPNKSQNLCGVIANEKLNLRRILIKEIRTKLHKLSHGDKSINKNQLIGKISYMRFVRGIDDELTNKYICKLNDLIEPPFPDGDFRYDLKRASDKYLVRIENDDMIKKETDYGTGFFSKGFLITSKHVVEVEKTDKFDGDRGFYRVLRIYYFDNEHKSKCVSVNVLDAFYSNEIAFLKIDKIDLFKTKFLKITKLYETQPKTIYCSGCQIADPQSLGILIEEKKVLSTHNHSRIEGLILQRGSIFKGMSGGPAFDVKTFEVVGVNYQGHESGDVNQNNSLITKLDLSIFKNKVQWKPTELWLLKHPEWK